MQLKLTTWSPDPKGRENLPFRAGLGWLAATSCIFFLSQNRFSGLATVRAYLNRQKYGLFCGL